MTAEPASGVPIAIVGMACRYPGAANPRELWENVLAKREQFRSIPDGRLPVSAYGDPDPAAEDKSYALKAAVLDGYAFDWAARRIPKSAFEATDTAHWLALDTALDALRDAGMNAESLPAERTGVIVGNTLTGDRSRAEALRVRWPFVERVLRSTAEARALSGPDIDRLAAAMETAYKSVFTPVNEDTLAGGLSNTIAGRICNVLDVHGGGYTVDGACSSSLLAVATAADHLRSGALDVALAGGVDLSLDPFELVGFAKMGALASSNMRVFDRRADGFIAGEGCGFVVLRRLDDARRDGNFVYAVLRGWGISSDGRGGITAPSAAGQALAIRRAYEGAGYAPRDVEFFEAHGTGTAVGDPTELQGIASALEPISEEPIRRYGVTSLKSILGHTKAAAGIGGFMKAVAAVNRRIVPPLAGCRDPHPAFDRAPRVLYPVVRGAVRDRGQTLRAGVSAAGFGGINCHVTIESGDAPAERLAPELPERALLASSQTTEVFVVSGPTRDVLRERIAEARRLAWGMSRAEMPDLAFLLAGRVTPSDEERAALVAGEPEDLLSALEELDRLVASSRPDRGRAAQGPGRSTWVGRGSTPPRLGFLFPGQGSQALDMARSLVERHDWAKTLVDETTAWLAEVGARSVEPCMFRPLDRALDRGQIDRWRLELTPTEVAQPAVALASLLWLKKLTRLGLRPAVVGGHSLGELVAFHAAGAFDERTLLRFAAVRGQAMATTGGGPGAMLALRCGRETAERLVARCPGRVAVACINGPNETVVSGEPSAVDDVASRARRERLPAQRLNVSAAFHSDLMGPAARRLRETAPVPDRMGRPLVRLLGSADGEAVAEGCDLREHFHLQVLRPVDFVSLVTRMAGECDLVLEVGPGRVLSSLAREVLGEDGVSSLPVESAPGEDGDINRILARVFVQGGRIDWRAVFEDRLVKPFVPASEKRFIENPCERPLHGRRPGDADRTTSTLPSAVPVGPHGAGKEGDARSILVDLIAARTGFPEDSLTTELRLLNDLNLDSIKASELIAAATERLGIAGRIDPAEFAGSTLGDIASVLDRVARRAAGAAPTAEKIAGLEAAVRELAAEFTGRAVDAIAPTARLLEDLRLTPMRVAELSAQAARRAGIVAGVDLSKSASPTLADLVRALERAARSSDATDRPTTPEIGVRWVRDFSIDLVEDDSPRVTADRAFDVLVVRGEAEKDDAAAIAGRARASMATVREGDFSGPVDWTDPGRSAHRLVVAILPRARDDEPASAEVRLRSTIARLSSAIGTAVGAAAGGPTTLVFVQWVGARPGFSPAVPDYASCCAGALAASLHLERPDLRVRVLGFEHGVGDSDLAEAVLREASTDASFDHAVFDAAGRRRVPRPQVLDRAAYRPRAFALGPDDLVLVTGGAKGVTAECALELARRTGARMVLVGSSASPDATAARSEDDPVARTLERYRDLGLSASYRSCDVTSDSGVAALVASIESEIGPITGVIHGAGLNRPAPAASVGPADAHAEVAPKVLGAINLCRALAGRPLEFVAGITSIIGVTGMPGNAWYGFSNEVLDLILGEYAAAHPRTSVVSCAFTVWGDTGMAHRMGIVRRVAASGVAPLTTAAAVEHFCRLIERDPGVRQVVVASRVGGLDTWRPQTSQPPAASNFLQEIVTFCPGVELVARTRLTPDTHPFLHDHAWRGTLLLPVVFGLEAMAQAAACVTGRERLRRVTIDDLRVERPIVVPTGSETDIEIRAEVLENPEPAREPRVRVGIATTSTGFGVEHFSATFALGGGPLVSEDLDRLPGTALDLDPRDLYGWLLFQGPSFRRLARILSLDSRRCVFEAERRPRAASATGSWLLGDPYFRDALLHGGQLVVSQDISLPVRIERIEIGDAASDQSGATTCIAVLQEKTTDFIRSSVQALDGEGRVSESLSGFVQKILEHHDEFPTAEELADPGPRDGARCRESLEDHARQLGLSLPQFRLSHRPGLVSASREERHAIELPEIRALVASAAAASSISLAKPATVRWAASGRPRLVGSIAADLDVSLAHDGPTLLVTAGRPPQGCDLATVTARSRDAWLALLGPRNAGLLGDLTMAGDDLDTAGTRLWALGEAARKALCRRRVSLALVGRDADATLFRARAGEGSCTLLALPLRLSRGRMVVLALVASP